MAKFARFMFISIGACLLAAVAILRPMVDPIARALTAALRVVFAPQDWRTAIPADLFGRIRASEAVERSRAAMFASRIHQRAPARRLASMSMAIPSIC